MAVHNMERRKGKKEGLCSVNQKEGRGRQSPKRKGKPPTFTTLTRGGKKEGG